MKPGNILLTADGDVKLADFGLARRWEDDESRVTLTEEFVGTAAYLAPEHLVDGSLSWPGFVNRYSVGQVAVVDEDGDGRDEVLVQYTHDGLWPSYSVAYDPRSDSSRLVLVASGHHRFVRALDLGATRGRALLFTGPNNLMGWYAGYAAVRVGPTNGDPIAFTPDLEQAPLSGALAWYALGPQFSTTETRALLSSARAEILFRTGHGREAYELADRAAIEIRAAAPRDVYCRGHLAVAMERLARLSKSARH